ncbi:MAG: hypothetical protein ACK42L_03920, partial [Thermoanaerobaculum sp.]
RLWRQRWALPLVFFEDKAEKAGFLELVMATPQKLVVQTESPAAQRLGIRWKFRPRIQKAFLDGQPVTIHGGLFPWSAVEIPAGKHQLTLRVSLPHALWLAPLVALAILVAVRKVQP